MEIYNLKPCPFCGEFKNIGTEKLDPHTWIIVCDNCGTATGMWRTEEEVIDFWNKRAKLK